MPNYLNSKIYKIYDISNEELVYYGSTTQRLCQRKAEHIKDSKKENFNGASKTIINNNNWKMELVQSYPCINRMELELLEGEYIKNNKCINIVIAGRTQDEYYNDNKDKIKAYKIEWRKNNKDYYKQQLTCKCGCIITRFNFKRHQETEKHIKLMEEKNNL